MHNILQNIVLGIQVRVLWVVLRGFVYLPLFFRGQRYVVYLFFTTGGRGLIEEASRDIGVVAALSMPTYYRP